MRKSGSATNVKLSYEVINVHAVTTDILNLKDRSDCWKVAKSSLGFAARSHWWRKMKACRKIAETLCNTQVQEHQAPIDTIETTLATFFHVTIWNLQTDTRWTQRGPLLASIRTCTSFVDGVPPLSSTWRTIGKAKLEHKGKKLDQNGPMNSKGQITPMRLNDVKWCQMFKVSVLILSVSECVLGNRKAPWCNAARAGWCEGTMHPKTSNNRISTCKKFFM